jgi:transcriptional regulator with XRE-family HTH domain
MKSGIPSDFGERVRQLRARFGLSIPKFAALVGFDRSYVFRLENGDADNPSLKFIEAVVQKFGVDREWFVGGVGDGNSLRVDVVPYRSGIDGHIRTRFESLQTIVESYNDAELGKAIKRFNRLAQKDARFGKIFSQIADFISWIWLRKKVKGSGDQTPKKSKSKSALAVKREKKL